MLDIWCCSTLLDVAQCWSDVFRVVLCCLWLLRVPSVVQCGNVAQCSAMLLNAVCFILFDVVQCGLWLFALCCRMLFNVVQC